MRILTSPRGRLAVALGATLALAGTVLGGAPAAASGGSPAPPVAWAPCTEEPLLGFDCATYSVPLDHDKPRGATIPIALARRAADDPARRLGTIFINPGGPGGAGRGFVAAAEFLFQAPVLARYDVVGFDPRGIGASAPIQCFATDAESEALFAQMALVPLTREQISATIRANLAYTNGCVANAGPLLPHMSTLNVVKDLDLLRAGVGDRKLSYVGYSYGTMIGATYANVFPSRVGRLILDGNVDPDQRANRRLANKLDRAGGFELALRGFLAACDAAGPDCAFSGGARAKFDALRELLRKGPVETPDFGVITIDDLTNFVAGSMYSVADFPATAEVLQLVYDVLLGGGAPVRAAGAGPLLPEPRHHPMRDAYSYNSNDSFYAVNCVDAPLPRNPAPYPALGLAFEAVHRTFGRYELYGEVGCANWPRSEERYAGPWNRRTATTIQLVNPTYDPATRYAFAQRMQAELGNARLLTLDGFGHTSSFSACVEGWYTRYLLDGALPPPGTRCAQDLPPFPAA